MSPNPHTPTKVVDRDARAYASTCGQPLGASADPFPGARPTAAASMWQQSAQCRDEDVDAFFHPDGERGHARTLRQQAAKAICAQCAVSTDCRRHALAYREPFGVWGGLSEEDRARLLGISRWGRPVQGTGTGTSQLLDHVNTANGELP